jgi:hypothetical protein
VVGVARPSAAALGEEDRGQPESLDEFEQAVLLAVTEDALGACQDGVVVGEHGTRAAFAPEAVAVDARCAGDEPVGGRARDEVVDVSAVPLGCYREPAVLDERPGVDEVVEVLPRRPAARRVSALDRLGPGLIFGESSAVQELPVVVAERVVRLPRVVFSHGDRTVCGGGLPLR